MSEEFFVAPAEQVGRPQPGTTCAASTGGKSKFNIIVREPSEEELRTSFSDLYDRVSHTFLDRWPEDLMALSFPTKFIPVDPRMLRDAMWNHKPDFAAWDDLAARLDAEMSWESYFVRLNSRSPKDASWPDMPVTLSGKQAVSWIAASERCLDDSGMFHYARQPMFICLRQRKFMRRESEFRCFARDGLLLGVSRYFYDLTTPIEIDHDVLWDAAQRFYDHHLLARYPTIVFDLYAPGTPDETLIEINPYGASDPCLFRSYAELEGNPGVRLVADTSPEEVAHPIQPEARQGRSISGRTTTKCVPPKQKGKRR